MKANTLIVILVVAASSYALGVLSLKNMIFPIPQFMAVKDLILPNPDLSGYSDTSQRTPVDCALIKNSSHAVILTLGQSMADNAGDEPIVAQKGVYNFNFLDGKCYHAMDPLLGTTASGGSVWTRLGNKIIKNKIFDNVLFVPIAVGGTSIKQWVPRGESGSFARIKIAIDGLRRQGHKITHIFWVQGSQDARGRMKKSDYIERFMEISSKIRDLSVTSPIFVAQSTICRTKESAEIGAAQRLIPSYSNNIFAGPNIDQINKVGQRYDGCHMSSSGLEEHANLWLKTILKYKSHATPR
jgi:hypothetical protein